MRTELCGSKLKQFMKLPDGPKKPTWLQNWQWLIDPIGYMEAAYNRYGDIFTASLGHNASPTVFVSDPLAIKQILCDHERVIAPPGGDGTLTPLIGPSSVFMLEGKQHKQRRKILMPSFHDRGIQFHGDQICQIAEQVFSQQEIGKPFSIRTAAEDISLQVILKVVFGIYEGERYEELMSKLRTILSFVFGSPLSFGLLAFPALQVNFGSWSPWGYFLGLRQQIDELLYAEIRERRCNFNSEKSDILSLLMSTHDEDGQFMTDENLRDELIALLMAGYDTTASSLIWALCWIHHLPEVRKRLLEEIDGFDNTSSQINIARLPYLSAVCDESLRNISTVTLARQVKKSVNLMGYQLEPGTMLAPCMYLLHQRKDLYPDPKQFRPERFLKRDFSPFEFMPFGGGSRLCIGYSLAPFEIKLSLSTILSRYQLELVDKKPLIPQRRAVFLVPAGDIKMLITGRRL